MPTEFKTCVGRIVWGNPAKSQPKKHMDGAQKGQPVLKDGQPVEQWAFGVAFPKAEFQQYIWPYMAQEAAQGYPNGTPPRFSWKYKDCDSIDNSGQPYSAREGYAGCYVLTISSEAFAPPIYKFENGGYRQLQPHEIKTGDYVVVALSLKVNVPRDPQMTPSLYINPQAIELVGYGEEIQNGPDPMSLFGGAQHQLPPGASAMPVASSGGVGMPGTGGGMPQGAPQPAQYQQPQAPQPQGMPQGAPQPQGMPQGAPQPAYDFVHQQQPQGMPQGAPQPGQMPGMMPSR